MPLGTNIKLVRHARGLGLTELAHAAGISASHLSLIENGRRSPSVTVLRSIAQHLRVPSNVLLWEPSSAEQEALALNPQGIGCLLHALYGILSELSIRTDIT